MAELLGEITKTRLKYDNERESILKEYEGRLAKLNAEKSEIARKDFASDYKVSIDSSYSSLMNFFNHVRKEQAKTEGLDFSIQDYYRSLKARDVFVKDGPYLRKMDAFEYFDRINREVHEAFDDIIFCDSLESETIYLKEICQCLKDLEFLKINSNKMLNDSDVVKKEKKKLVEKNRAEIEKNEFEKEERLQLRNLDVYSDIHRLRQKIEKRGEEFQKNLISDEWDSSDPKKLVLIGRRTLKMDKKDTDFVHDVLSLETVDFSQDFVFYDACSDSSKALCISYSDYDYKTEYNAREFFKKMIDSFAYSFKKPFVKFGIMNLSESDPYMYILLEGLMESDKGITDGFEKFNGKYSNDIDSFLQKIKQMQSMRSLAKGNEKNFVSFVEKDESNRYQLFVLFIIYDPKYKQKIDNEFLCRSVFNGIYPVLIGNGIDQDDDIRKYADVVSVSFNDVTKGEFNSTPVSFDIVKKGFNEDKFRTSLLSNKKTVENARGFTLAKMFKRFEDKKDQLDFSKALYIPMGLDGNSEKLFEITLDYEKANFIFLYASSGSGKSSFLHNFILSLAHFYTPEQVELYLCDLKSDAAGQASPEFVNYRKGSGNKDSENLYVPHVRYLCLNSTQSNVKGLVLKIEALKNERGRIFDSNHVKSFTEYNSKFKEKMPYIIFIIDEYESLFTGNDYQDVVSKMRLFAQKYRSYGFCIIFSGPVPLLRELNNEFQIRIMLKVASSNEVENVMQECLSFDSQKYLDFLRKKEYGNALFSSDLGKNISMFQCAYSGKSSDAAMKNIAKDIRMKYQGKEYMQFEVGQDSSVSLADLSRTQDIKNDYEILGEDGLKSGQQQIPYFLPIGYSSILNALCNVCFQYGKENRSNFACYAGTDKTLRVESILALMFLSKNRKVPHVVIYCSTKKNRELFFDCFKGEEDFMKEVIRSETDKNEVYQIIESLDREYETRKADDQNNVSRENKPIFLILDSLYDLMGEKSVSSGNVSSSKTEGPTDSDDDMLNQLSLDSIGKKTNAVTREEKPEPVDLNLDKMKEWLENLWIYGYRYGIFVLYSTSMESHFQGKSYENVIFDSCESSEDKLSDFKSNNSVYLKWMKMDVSLVDISPWKKENREWWSEFKEEMGK